MRIRTCSSVLALAAIFGAQPASGQGSDALLEAPWRAFNVGDFPTFAPQFMAAGDMDGDGDLDVVAGREYYGGPGISVLFHNGDGSFAPPVVYETGYGKNIGGVALNDFDFDGDLDVIASMPDLHGQSFKVYVWRNAGNGTLGSPQQFFTGEGPLGIAVADFTGDGFPDVATADNGYVAGQNNTVSILRHNGQSGAGAGFLAPIHYTVGDNCHRVEAGDLDDDGDIDLVVGRGDLAGNGGFGVAVLFNDGSGVFSNQVHLTVGNPYRFSPAVELADIDNDDDLDILYGAGDVNAPRGIVTIRRNNGSGQFGAAEEIGLGQGTFTPWQIITSDLNRDGWLDIIVSTPSGRANDGYNLVMSDGSGGFNVINERFEAAKYTYDLLSFDVENDGDADILTIANDSSVLTVHQNLGDGTFFIPERFGLGFITKGFDIGDIEHDGDIDVVTGSDYMRVQRNRGDGTFPPFDQYTPPFSIGDLVLRDLNGDGFDDVLMATDPNDPPYGFGVAINNGDGTFQQPVGFILGASQGGKVEAFDLDNDGDRDVILTDPGPASVIYLIENFGDGLTYSLRALLADDDGLPFGIDGGDLDHDGNIDLMTSNALGLTAYLGNGDFTFEGPFPSSTSAFQFEIFDLNADGDLDVAMILPQDSFGTVEVATIQGFGDGSFSFPNVYPAANGREGAFRISSHLDVGDVNNDGIPDLLTTNNAPNDISIFFGNGDGTLQPLEDRYGVGYSPSFSGIADFDNDGRNDVASVISLQPSGLYDALVVLFGRDPSGGGGSAAMLVDATVRFGTHLSGTVDSLRTSDDVRYMVRSGFGFSALEANLIEIVVGAETDVAAPDTFDVSIEGRIDHPTGRGQLRLFNWSTNRYRQVHEYTLGMTERVEEITGIDATNRVRDPGGEGRVQIMLRHIVVASFSLAGFQSHTDHIAIDVR